jgi:hypothetical protein
MRSMVVWAEGRRAEGKWWRTGVVSTTTAAAHPPATRTVLTSAFETAAAAAAAGHATAPFGCCFCLQGGGIDLWRVWVVVSDGGLLLLCFLVGLSRLLFLRGRCLLIGITILAGGLVLGPVGSEDGMILNVGHKIPEWVWRGIEIVDRRHDVRCCVGRYGLKGMDCGFGTRKGEVDDG